MADIASLGVSAILRDVARLEAVEADLNLLGSVELAVTGNVAGLVAEAAEGLGGAVLHEVADLAAVVAVLLLRAVAGDVAGLPTAAAEKAGGAVAGDVPGLVAVPAEPAEAITTDERAATACVALASATVADGVRWSLHCCCYVCVRGVGLPSLELFF